MRGRKKKFLDPEKMTKRYDREIERERQIEREREKERECVRGMGN